MLERATACFTSGALRESLKCAQPVPRSRRLLRSAFWSHGAGDLDLPLWTLSNQGQPLHPASKLNNIQQPLSESVSSAPASGSAIEGVLLDFLYPPQALALLQKGQRRQCSYGRSRSGPKHSESPVVASRGYATVSFEPFGEDAAPTGPRKNRQHIGVGMKKHLKRQAAKIERAEMSRAEHLERDERGDVRVDMTVNDAVEEVVSNSLLPKKQRPKRVASRKQVSSHMKGENPARKRTDVRSSFADSPGELSETTQSSSRPDTSVCLGEVGVVLSEEGSSPARQPYDSPDPAETTADRGRVLRSIFAMSNRSGNANDQALTQRAWAIYESLELGVKNDHILKIELLRWLAAQDNDLAGVRCQQVYRSIPKLNRTSEVYQTMLLRYLRLAQYDQATELHREALSHLENGYTISRLLFKHAVESNLWQLARDTAVQHNAVFTAQSQIGQVRVFWLHVSEIPQLLQKSLKLAKHFGFIEGLSSADQATRDFCYRFFKEAISKELLDVRDASPLTFSEESTFITPPRRQLRALFQHVIDMEVNPAVFVEEILLKALQRGSDRQYFWFHHILSFLYTRYCALPSVVPSERLLLAFLRRLVEKQPRVRKLSENVVTVSITALVNDWKRYHGRLSSDAVVLLMVYHARTGQVQPYKEIQQYFEKEYPIYEFQRGVLWTRVNLFAQRADLDQAQRAFSEVQRIMDEHGERPDLRCWNVLLQAHMRADDLEGGLTNFNNLIHYAKLKPDQFSFAPILHLLARRGDPEGVEALIQQYDQMVGGAKSVGTMMALLEAHFNNNDNAHAAERVLRTIVSMHEQGEVVGSLTPCYNALMRFYAIRRDMDSVMRTYRSMRQVKASLDGDTFGALILVLVHYRQAGPAYTMLRKVMPENKIVPTQYHYSLIMAGLTKQGMFARAVEIYEEMRSRNVRPSPSVNSHYLRAKAGLERAQLDAMDNEDAQQLPLTETLEELKNMLARYDVKELLAGQPVTATDRSNLGDPIASYFDELIYVHGERKCFEAVQQLAIQYKENSQPGQHGMIPLRLVAALMALQLRAGDHAKVEEYWKLAKQLADDLARTVTVPSFASRSEKPDSIVDLLDATPSTSSFIPEAVPKGAAGAQNSPVRPLVSSQKLITEKRTYEPRPVPARSHILDAPLQWYIRALSAQSRLHDAIELVSQHLSQGYTLTKTSWNMFIRTLLDTRPPLALLAFVLTERFLIPNFPGWQRHSRYFTRPAERKAGLQVMNARYIPRNHVVPEYLTMVRLGSAMLDLRRAEATGNRAMYARLPKELRKFVGTIKDVRARAARTVYAIQTMPAVPDKMQAAYLEREEG